MPPTVDMQSLVDTHERPFMVIDQSFIVIAVNHAFEKSNGVKADRVVGRTCYEVSHKATKPCFQLGEECLHRQVYETQMPHSCLHIHYDKHHQKHRVRITVHPIIDTQGNTFVGESIQELSEKETLSNSGISMIGASPPLLQMMEQLVLVARTDSAILLQGETGTGKELAASFLHHNSERTMDHF